MNKINWKQKLTSRKFWAAVVGFVTALLIGFGVGDNDITQVTSIIMAGATLIAYIIGEGLVDASRNNTESQDNAQ
jgi:phosphate/sulfate permease